MRRPPAWSTGLRGATCSLLGLALCGLAGLYLTDGRQHLAYRVINIVSWALLTWMVVRVVFSLFRDWANRPSPTFAYLSYASYSIYLFHHLVVIATATALLPLPLGGGVKFLIVLATASIVPLAIHHFLIRRYDVLGYLFNGRVVPQAGDHPCHPPGVPSQPGTPSSEPAVWPTGSAPGSSGRAAGTCQSSERRRTVLSIRRSPRHGRSRTLWSRIEALHRHPTTGGDLEAASRRCD